MIEATTFKQRREKLQNDLDSNSVVILVGNTEKVRSKNFNYLFRQNNDFFYLTGFDEPDAVAVIRPGHEKPYTLFCRGKDPLSEVYFGERAGPEGACEQFLADQAFDIQSLEQNLPSLLETRGNIYLSDELGRFDGCILHWLNWQRSQVKFDDIKCYPSLHQLSPWLHEQRKVKSPEEIAQIRKAVSASAVAHTEVMKATRPGVTENYLAGIFYQNITEHGCQDVAYPSIVAAGNNANCLHYVENNKHLVDGELLLIDAGGEFNKYCADITRTFPVNGRFNAEQKELYQLILFAQEQAMGLVRPGLSWNDIYFKAMSVMLDGLLQLGFLKGDFNELFESEAYRQYTVCKTGHWLGMDVHDVGSYQDQSGWHTLTPGMVFTLEPGIYLPKDSKNVPERFQGMGLRVEDDLLVTDSGYENLSIQAPRSLEDIEAVMN